ncbi:hypothetical protein [Mucilaginibacter terrae]|nr:hypothetical protein [Mucilaginibacter terrae]
MLGHFIHFKGKGALVIVLPMLIAFVLFIIFNALNINDNCVAGTTLITSAIILFYLDYKRENVNTGLIQLTGKIQSGKNTVLWIDMRYWAVLMGVGGMISLMQLA